MQSIQSFTRFAGILSAAFCISLSPAWAQAEDLAPVVEEQQAPADLLDFLEGDHVIGNPEAPVKVIEYASLSCSHCMRFHTQTYPQLKEQYIDTGKIAFVFRHFPLNEPALRGAMLAECAGDEKFYQYLKVLFHSQPEWAYDADFKESLRSIARIGGLGDEAFDACMANKELEDRIVSGIKWAASGLQVQSTPTVFINNEKQDGFRSIEELAPIIDAELKKAAQ